MQVLRLVYDEDPDINRALKRDNGNVALKPYIIMNGVRQVYNNLSS